MKFRAKVALSVLLAVIGLPFLSPAKSDCGPENNFTCYSVRNASNCSVVEICGAIFPNNYVVSHKLFVKCMSYSYTITAGKPTNSLFPASIFVKNCDSFVNSSSIKLDPALPVADNSGIDVTGSTLTGLKFVRIELSNADGGALLGSTIYDENNKPHIIELDFSISDLADLKR